MTRYIAIAVAVIALAVLLGYLGLSVYSRRAPPLGLVEGKLRPCPERPNCVVSDAPGANVEPIAFTGPSGAAWEVFTDLVIAAGGRVTRLTPDYVHATFVSTYFRFVDDFEARLDTAAGVIHVRSASRVGYSDRGVNRKRVEALRTGS